MAETDVDRLEVGVEVEAKRAVALGVETGVEIANCCRCVSLEVSHQSGDHHVSFWATIDSERAGSYNDIIGFYFEAKINALYSPKFNNKLKEKERALGLGTSNQNKSTQPYRLAAKFKIRIGNSKESIITLVGVGH